ncbi:ribonuclease t2 [Moniliophthora roreri]|nr:ribonuclease t2 [Moniliophthora roreri]
MAFPPRRSLRFRQEAICCWLLGDPRHFRAMVFQVVRLRSRCLQVLVIVRDIRSRSLPFNMCIYRMGVYNSTTLIGGRTDPGLGRQFSNFRDDPESALQPLTPFASLDVLGRDVALDSGCSVSGSTSCHNTSVVSNLCCFEAPGVRSLDNWILPDFDKIQGLLMQTQFWDTNPPQVPMLVGQYMLRRYLRTVLRSISCLHEPDIRASSTLEFMQEFWVSLDGDDESFWEVSSGGNLLLATGGSTAFSSDGVPSGTTAFQVFAGSGHSQGYTLSIVAV